jgi:hypothetical protein
MFRALCVFVRGFSSFSDSLCIFAARSKPSFTENREVMNWIRCFGDAALLPNGTGALNRAVTGEIPAEALAWGV